MTKAEIAVMMAGQFVRHEAAKVKASVDQMLLLAEGKSGAELEKMFQVIEEARCVIDCYLVLRK